MLGIFRRGPNKVPEVPEVPEGDPSLLNMTIRIFNEVKPTGEFFFLGSNRINIQMRCMFFRESNINISSFGHNSMVPNVMFKGRLSYETVTFEDGKAIEGVRNSEKVSNVYLSNFVAYNEFLTDRNNSNLNILVMGCHDPTENLSQCFNKTLLGRDNRNVGTILFPYTLDLTLIHFINEKKPENTSILKAPIIPKGLNKFIIPIQKDNELFKLFLDEIKKTGDREMFIWDLEKNTQDSQVYKVKKIIPKIEIEVLEKSTKKIYTIGVNNLDNLDEDECLRILLTYEFPPLSYLLLDKINNNFLFNIPGYRPLEVAKQILLRLGNKEIPQTPSWGAFLSSLREIESIGMEFKPLRGKKPRSLLSSGTPKYYGSVREVPPNLPCLLGWYPLIFRPHGRINRNNLYQALLSLQETKNGNDLEKILLTVVCLYRDTKKECGPREIENLMQQHLSGKLLGIGLSFGLSIWKFMNETNLKK